MKGKGRGANAPGGHPSDGAEAKGPGTGVGNGSPQASTTGGSSTSRPSLPTTRDSPQLEDESRMSGFFEDELRGYRLLKACQLGPNERQKVLTLTLTGNSTGFQSIRQALRSLYDEGMAEHANRRPRQNGGRTPTTRTATAAAGMSLAPSRTRATTPRPLFARTRPAPFTRTRVHIIRKSRRHTTTRPLASD